jgi:D-beta-D-heptose 7-phosphate kinase/D-beta-D-heptose 1-phosphate adenosyltransferase
MPTRLIEIAENLPKARVLLVGDLMIDRYVYGAADRLSPDAPVPVLHHHHEDCRLGGAGRVAADLATLGASVSVVSVLGCDDTGREIRRLLAELGADTSGVIEASQRPSTAKVRFVGLARDRHPQQMMRLDYEDSRPIDDALVQPAIAQIERLLANVDAVCIEDYNKGLCRPELCRALIEMARARGVPVLIDPARVSDYSKYAGATVITPNRTEAEAASGLPAKLPEQFQACAERLLDALDLEASILTLDRHGAYLATRDGERRWLKTRERTVYDVAGAGDMVLCTLTMARVAGASWPEAVALANIAGGLEVERFGSVPVTRDEILQELLREAHEQLGKHRTLDRLLPELARHRASGKTIVFTNGCFDIVHVGHTKYFQWAKKQGDLLVVGVNTDAGIRRLKGPKRPVINEEDRIAVLEELRSIDYLVRFDEDTPIELIRQIRPDVLVKGQDYTKEQVIGWEFVESCGGRVALAPLIEGKSTSAVIQKIRDSYT